MKNNSDFLSNNKLYWVYLTGFFIILLLPILIFPPMFLPPDWGKTIVFKIVFSILLFTFCYQMLWDNGIQLFKKIGKPSTKNILFYFLLALLAVYSLATIFSTDMRFSLFGSPSRSGGFINYAFYILFAMMLFLLVQKKDWQKLWYFAIFTGVLVSIIGLISKFSLIPTIFVTQTDNITSTLGSTSILGLYMAILIYPTLAFAIKEPFGAAE